MMLLHRVSRLDMIGMLHMRMIRVHCVLHLLLKVSQPVHGPRCQGDAELSSVSGSTLSSMFAR